jgi:hypothetical protein
MVQNKNNQSHMRQFRVHHAKKAQNWLAHECDYSNGILTFPDLQKSRRRQAPIKDYSMIAIQEAN